MKDMKRIVTLLMMVFVLVISLDSCKKSIEKQAETQLETSLHKLVPDAKNMQLSDVKTKYCSDSLCILQCTIDLKNGVTPAGQYEYIYLLKQDKKFESIANIKESGSILTDYDLKHLSPEDESNVYIGASIHCFFSGREIK